MSNDTNLFQNHSFIFYSLGLSDSLSDDDESLMSFMPDSAYEESEFALNSAYEESQVVINEGIALLNELGEGNDTMMGDPTAHKKRSAQEKDELQASEKH